MLENFAVIAKPVGSRCNMNCAYCYYLEKAKYSTSQKQSRMSFSVLEKLIKQTIEANQGPVVSFTWHGGEPAMAGLDFYKKVVELERKYLPEGWQAWNNLQTNGLLINDEWCRFLKENHFDVGLSIDGDCLTHDKNRVDLAGKATYQRVRKAVLRLKKHGILPDLLCTVTRDSQQNPLAVYQALKELDTGWIQFIPVIVKQDDGSIDPISATPEGYGHFLCTIFNEWIKEDLGKLDVQIFAETSRVLAGGQASACFMRPVCGNVLVAEEDGSIYSCDHFVDDEHRLGNLHASSMKKMISSQSQQEFGLMKKTALTKECQQCSWLKICHGGCLKDRFGVSCDNEPGQYILCKGLKQYFAYAQGPLEMAMKMSREKKTVKQIMTVMKDELGSPQ